jgi:hypothetical protein
MSPLKEPHFFTFEGDVPIFNGPGGQYYRRHAVQRRIDYLQLFAAATNQRAIGEVSSSYLYSPVAASRIKRNYPSAKIIVLLRQPADRAYSRYQYNRFHLLEHADDFNKALKMENLRKKQGWLPVFYYKEEGYYYRSLKIYYDNFSPENIKVCLYDEFIKSPYAVLQEIFSFLDVEIDFKPELRQKNVTLVPKVRAIHRIASDMQNKESCFTSLIPSVLLNAIVTITKYIDCNFNLISPPPLDSLTRRRLTEEYCDDIQKLQSLIGQDLSQWLKSLS